MLRGKVFFLSGASLCNLFNIEIGGWGDQPVHQLISNDPVCLLLLAKNSPSTVLWHDVFPWCSCLFCSRCFVGLHRPIQMPVANLKYTMKQGGGQERKDCD